MVQPKSNRGIRLGIVNSTTLVGNEIKSILRERSFPFAKVALFDATGEAAGALTDLGDEPAVVEKASETSFDDLDLVFLALPHGESQRLVPDLLGRVGHLVDLGADFRLPAASYEQWYGQPHTAPALLARFTFGLPELFRAHLTPGTAVAAPGCYPTAAALALAPLLATGLAEPTGLIVNAASGIDYLRLVEDRHKAALTGAPIDFEKLAAGLTGTHGGTR